MEGSDSEELNIEHKIMCTSDDEYRSDDEDFYFESDHLALRGNSDYRAVLRTIVILEAQRIEAAKHIDKIAEAHKKATNDPETFVKKLATGDSLNLPGQISVQNVRNEENNLSIDAVFKTFFSISASKNQIRKI